MFMEMLSFLGQTHVAVTEKFTITDILNVVTQLNVVLQLKFCKRIQHLFKYPTKKS